MEKTKIIPEKGKREKTKIISWYSGWMAQTPAK